MILEMKVPSPGESIKEVEIATWLVKDGDYVEKDQAIAEVDSDKATLELPAEASGIITLKAEEGDAVAVGAVVCLIDTAAAKPEGSAPAPSASALSGLTRRFVTRGTDKFINGSKIIATDIPAANGTVHAIDKVLIATGGNIVQSALAVQSGGVFVKPELTYLVAAVVYADLVSTLANPAANYTVFAPTDEAFIKLFKALGIQNPKPSDITTLPVATVQAVLANHVITTSGMFTSEMNAGTQTAFGGQTLTFGAYNNGVLTVDGANPDFGPANMVIPDIQATNGVIHIIDTVLMPVL